MGKFENQKLSMHAHGNITQYNDEYQSLFFIKHICEILEKYKNKMVMDDMKFIPFYIGDGINLEDPFTFLELKKSINYEKLSYSDLNKFTKAFNSLFVNGEAKLTLVSKNDDILSEYNEEINGVNLLLTKEEFNITKREIQSSYNENYNIAEFFYNNHMKISTLTILIDLYKKAERNKVELKWLWEKLKKEKLSDKLIGNASSIQEQVDRYMEMKNRVINYLVGIKKEGINNTNLLIDTLEKNLITIKEYKVSQSKYLLELLSYKVYINMEDFTNGNDSQKYSITVKDIINFITNYIMEEEND